MSRGGTDTEDMSIEVKELISQLLESEFTSDLGEEIAKHRQQANLEPTTPEKAVNKYFRHRDLKESTKKTHKSALENHFLPWCNQVADVDEMNTLTGSDLENYREWRRYEAPSRVDSLSKKSDETQQKIIRVFIKFCESINAVPPRLHESVLIPSLDEEDEIRESILSSERMHEILEYLDEYEYANAKHITMLLFSNCGFRVGDIRALDVEDMKTGENGPYLELKHRRETETPLKNDKKSERSVFITERLYEIINDYIDNRRDDATDEYGRKPLLSSPEGRLCESTIRNYVYWWTEPCSIGNECPIDKEPKECKASQRKNFASQCPESVSPHPVRKGYITHELSAGISSEILSERCDVSEKVLDKHYDMRKEKERMEARRLIMEKVYNNNTRYGE